MADKEKKRSGLGANPLDWIKDTSEAAEAASVPKAKPKRKPRTKKGRSAKNRDYGTKGRTYESLSG